jgi:hypothetical protein
VAEGLHITHWTSADLARQAVADGIVPAISERTVRRILHGVDLQPHRTRYWRTARLDAKFKQRAEKVLWCYANADRLVERGYCEFRHPRNSRIQSPPQGGVRRVYAAPKPRYQNSPLYAAMRSETCWVPSFAR